MIDESIILAFNGTIITGLFVFYAFFIALAKRLEDSGEEEAQITNAIYYLASVQSAFALSAILVLIGLANWAIVVTIFGLVLLIVCFFLLVFSDWLVQRFIRSSRRPYVAK
jgi:uncharacterized membrane protein YiaA